MNLHKASIAAFSLVLFMALSSDAFSQGKGKGNGSGNGKGNSGQSKGKSRDTPSDRDDDRGKPNKKDGLTGSDNRFRGLSKKLGRSPESVRDWYEAERLRNPNLKYGQFVAANMIAKNHPGVSAGDILDGLRRGDSIGQTLKRQGWKEDRIRGERTRLRDLKSRAEEALGDYVDRELDWRF